MQEIKKIVLTGGGSAGHCVPHLAILNELNKHFKVFYIGSNGIEKNIMSKYNIPFEEISSVKLNREFIFKNFLIPFKLSKSIKEAKKALLKINPDIIFSKGGYVALPVVLASKRLKIPVVTHESDLSLGLANKIISKNCKKVLTSFDITAKKLKNGIFTGAPIRGDLFYSDRAYALKRYNLPNRETILVFGGGSGSLLINNIIRECVFDLTEKYNVLHICGKGNLFDCNAYGYKQIEYENEMKYAYAAADLVISRAGSNTIFEIIALKKSSILIPLSNKATRGDQVQNANYFKSKNLCKVLYQQNLNKKTLLQLIDDTFEDTNLKQNLLKANITTGNKRIISEILKVISK